MKLKIFIIAILLILAGVFVFSSQSDHKKGPAAGNAPASSADLSSAGDPLGGYNVLIADRGNNRIIEVTPDKKIVWEYKFNLPKMGWGPDDAFFTDNGKNIIVNLEEYHIIQIIDYATKSVIWNYGIPGKPGSQDGMLNTPDDAYKLPNGNITVADVKNCRIIEISPDKKIVRQYGQTGVCKNDVGFTNKPNGDTPLPDGHTYISNIVGKSLVELDPDWKQIFTMVLPVKYPSDPQLDAAGNILISDYSYPGKIVEVTKQGQVLWQFDGQEGDVKLNHPSLAVELPNGNILTNDDYNHRVIVIDKQTKKIVWQYGVTGRPGSRPGELSIPDGVNIIMRKNAPAPATVSPLSIGAVSRHPKDYVDTSVTMTGYVLQKENGYAIFSDESAGKTGYYDLPVSGPEVANLSLKQKYTITGILRSSGLSAINHNPYHLELTNVSY